MEVNIQASVMTLENGDPALIRLKEKDEKLPQRTLVALDGECFLRRQHIRPFESKRKLSGILPSLLEDSLLKADTEEKLHHVLTTSSLEKNKFTSYSIREDVLKEQLQHTEKFNTPLLGVAPLPLGLSYYAPEEQNSIIVAPASKGVQAVFVNKSGVMADFRIFSNNKWKEQAGLTLQAWMTQVEGDVSILTTDDIAWPSYIDNEFKAKIHTLTLPKGVNSANAAAYGLLHIFEENWYPELAFSCEDKTTKETLNNTFRKLNKTLPVLLLACLFGSSQWGYNYYRYSQEENFLQGRIDTIFDETLPNTPMVDAPLQLTRRANELALLSGRGLVNSSPLSSQLVSLQKRLSQSGIGTSLDDLNISENTFKIRGQVASLSHVDSLQGVLRDVFEGYEVELKSAQIGDDGKVNYHVEAMKK